MTRLAWYFLMLVALASCAEISGDRGCQCPPETWCELQDLSEFAVVCIPRKSQGERCTVDAEEPVSFGSDRPELCLPGLACNTDLATCEPPLKLGEPCRQGACPNSYGACTHPVPCEPGLGCSGATSPASCQPPAPEGATCGLEDASQSWSSGCAAPLVCNLASKPATCREDGLVGSPCTNPTAYNGGCSGTLDCDESTSPPMCR